MVFSINVKIYLTLSLLYYFMTKEKFLFFSKWEKKKMAKGEGEGEQEKI